MTIKMQSVTSSSIDKIGYRYRTMEVKFNNGRTYQFKGVPRAVFDRFAQSSSKGEFFNEQIRGSYLDRQV